MRQRRPDQKRGICIYLQCALCIVDELSVSQVPFVHRLLSPAVPPFSTPSRRPAFPFSLLQVVHFGSPFQLAVDDLFRVFSLLSGGAEGMDGDGGIETLALDVDLKMHDILDELFPPADKAWKNLRKIHIMSSWTDVEQLMTHLYKRG